MKMEWAQCASQQRQASSVDTPLHSPRIEDWEKFDGMCRAVAFSADGKRLFTGLGWDIVAWDTASGGRS